MNKYRKATEPEKPVSIWQTSGPSPTAAMSRLEDQKWADWNYDPQTYAGPPVAPSTVLDTFLGHGKREIVRAGHVNWDKPGDPRMVVRWRGYQL